MTQNWNHPDTARLWDAKGNRRNPIRFEQLDILVSILESAYAKDAWILDLGYGSGQVEKLIFERLPEASVVGVDNSEAMMELAKQRLSENTSRFVSVRHDLGDIDTLSLPNHKYQFVIAIQSLHHLSKEQMQAVYRYIYRTLEPGGLFLLLDRLQVETKGLWEVYHTVWARQDRLYESTVASHEGTSFEDHQRTVLDRGDYPVLLDEHLEWLRKSGFEAACLHAHGHRALIVGRKPLA
ncbi:class I SAM-dependent methyltransferase [Alicyclobacillus fastidiosus]|uniref:Class I SAM-dependent methyltransferase n=1 Tax=Alicyclobacillus fastidiosus TaxID=392011 RepID=A0ABV5ACF8_9BACL|nr:class I SAM-dependent methyltransferase [Alicyclobacillus fastidiosus]WEH11381.1 class I SAM-dependent methyltransferase [Alicyclobacillus fastidiosus]